MEYIKNFDSSIEQGIYSFKKTFYLKGFLHLLLVLYAGILAPKLPKEVLFLFENQYFKLFIFSLILWTAQISPSTAILISLAFMISMNAVNKKPLWEFLENVAAPAAKDLVPAAIALPPVPSLSVSSVPAVEPPTSTPQLQVVQSNVPVSTNSSIEAVKVLAQAAASNEASAPAAVANIANIVAANVTTEAGANALKQLAEQAIVPAPGSLKKIEEAVKKVVESIPPPAAVPVPAPIAQPPVPSLSVSSVPAVAPPTSTPQLQVVQSNVPVSTNSSIEAVKVLAQAAASNEASAPAAVANIANIVAANVTTEAGANALKQLAEQAIVPVPGALKKIEEAVKKVVESIPPPAAVPVPAPIAQVAQKVAVSEPAVAPPASTGCYPIRRYDMSKVESSRPSDKSSNTVFEEQQPILF